MGLPPSRWALALIRRHALGHPRLSSADEVSVLAIQAELHRIGVNVNQLARSVNATAQPNGSSIQGLGAELRGLREELATYLTALRQAFQGNLRYWDF